MADIEDQAFRVIHSRSGGVLQSELWKILDIDSRKCSRVVKKLLDRIGKLIGEGLSDITIILASHACEIGTAEYNLALSKRRGQNVKEYLESHHGIKPARIIVKPFGEVKPVAPNDTEVNRAKNRRVEIIGVRRG